MQPASLAPGLLHPTGQRRLLKAFRGRVASVHDGRITVELFSPTDQYKTTVPTDSIVVLPRLEELIAGDLYRPAGESDPEWLYDGEAFYPVDTFPRGAVGRDQQPPRLEDLGHLRDG